MTEFVVLNFVAAIQYPRISPVVFEFGPVAVRWYGLAYAVGFATAYLWLRRMTREGSLRLSFAQLDGLLSWLLVGVIAGGRLGWWLVYHRYEGMAEPWYEPIAIWHGGMSFHGALVGVALAMLIRSRQKGTDFWNVADCTALVVPVGLSLGRLANFINAELVGRITSVPWGLVFPGDSMPRHPSQLYEALLEGPVLLAFLWAIRRLRVAEGTVAAWFVTLYGVFRFLVEFTRAPDSQLGFIAFGWLTMGQALSTALVLIGLAFVARTTLVIAPKPRQPSDIPQ